MDLKFTPNTLISLQTAVLHVYDPLSIHFINWEQKYINLSYLLVKKGDECANCGKTLTA
jgi:hypothetical protein